MQNQEKVSRKIQDQRRTWGLQAWERKNREAAPRNQLQNQVHQWAHQHQLQAEIDIEELKDDIVDEVERNEINHPFNETDAEYEEWAKKTGRMDLEHVAPVEEAKTDVPML